MSSVNPPFRADQVGSLLRPKAILEAREQAASGKITRAELRQIEDDAIARVVKQQEAVGLQGITDGEFRRAFFHLDFLEQLEGVTVDGMIDASSNAAETVHFTPPKLSVTGKLRHARNIQVDDFNFLQAQVSCTPKVAVPSPTMVHFRGGRAAIDIHSYPDMDQFFEDLAQCYRDEIAALYAAGCRYLQLDDTNLAYLCDEKMREAARQRGDDPNELPHRYAGFINKVVAHKPAGMTLAMHLCRGNFKSTHAAAGNYEPVAEALLSEMKLDAFFLEYDDERSGDFKPLRYLSKDKIVVLGLVTTKFGAMESKDALKRRIDEAAKYAPLDQLCLSPQCGFSSTVHGNNIAVEDQRNKLRLVVEVAQEVWG